MEEEGFLASENVVNAQCTTVQYDILIIIIHHNIKYMKSLLFCDEFDGSQTKKQKLAQKPRTILSFEYFVFFIPAFAHFCYLTTLAIVPRRKIDLRDFSPSQPSAPCFLHK